MNQTTTILTVYVLLLTLQLVISNRHWIITDWSGSIDDCSTRNNAYTKAIINSEEELNIVGNLVRQNSDCSGEAGIVGSTNEDANMQFDYSELYFQNTSFGSNRVFVSTTGTELSLRSVPLSSTTGCFVCEAIVTVRMTFASTYSEYRLLHSRVSANYSEWAAMCSKIGNGWSPAILKTEPELEFLKVAMEYDTGSFSYWIGGTSRSIFPPYTYGFTPFRYCPSTSTIDDPGNFTGNSDNRKRFASPDSQYYRLAYDRTFRYNSSPGNCSSLGDGWAPAAMNSQREVDFLRHALRLRTCYPFCERSFWIGGSTDRAHLSNFEFSDYRTDNQGTNRVIISTWTSKTYYSLLNFQLKAISGSNDHLVYATLCEKSKA